MPSFTPAQEQRRRAGGGSQPGIRDMPEYRTVNYHPVHSDITPVQAIFHSDSSFAAPFLRLPSLPERETMWTTMAP